MPTVDDLHNVALAFLAAAETALQKTALGPPERAFVSPGEPALDCCDQLTTWISSISEADLQAGSGGLAPYSSIKRGKQPLVTIGIQITRCQQGLDRLGEDEMPDPVDLQAGAHAVDQDGWALRLGLMDSLRNGELARLCSGAQLLNAVKIIPQGTCIGWTYVFVYPIEGGILP